MTEIEAIETCYGALTQLDRHAQCRALDYLRGRLAEEQHEMEEAAKRHRGEQGRADAGPTPAATP